METAKRLCYHCGEPIPDGLNLQIELHGQQRSMCCQGCLAVASLISDAGLSNYYNHRQQLAAKADENSALAAQAWQAIDERQALWGLETASGDRDLLLQVSDIRCVACAWLIRRHLEEQTGILAVQVDVSSGFCRIQWQPSKTRMSEIATQLFGLGYTPHLPLAQAEEDGRRAERTASLKRLSVAGLGMMQVMMYAVSLYAGDAFGISDASRGFLSWVSLLVSFPVLLYSGRVFFQSAWRGLRSGRPGMDLPVSLAIGLAFLASCYHFFLGRGEIWFDSVVMFIFFLSLGRHVELVLRQRNLQAGSALARLLPEWANRLNSEDQIEVVPATDLRTGDRVRVMASTAFPADGILLRGHTSVDESLLTGESLAISKSLGDPVVAGSINLQQSVELQVLNNPEDSTVSNLGRLLLAAQARRNEDSGLPNGLVPGFILVVLSVALLSWWYWLGQDPTKAFSVALAVLVASCPCALSLALPVVRSSASLSLMQQGLLLTRPAALFDLLKTDHVVFDKTGTLTLGRPVVAHVITNPLRTEYDEPSVLSLAAALESHSNHAVAQAFRNYTPTAGVEGVISSLGEGLEGKLGEQSLRLGKQSFVLSDSATSPADDHSLWLADSMGWIARFELEDTLRPGAEALVKQLQNDQLELSLCSGDSEKAVKLCAERLAIEHYKSRQNPDDKIRYINNLHDNNKVVLMIGDGINDAPVLAAADVSITVHGASELANSAADIILTGVSLDGISRCFSAARKARKLVNQNLSWALLYNLSILPLAVSGLLQPWMAAIGMSASSLLVVLNATRMRYQPQSSATTPQLSPHNWAQT